MTMTSTYLYSWVIIVKPWYAFDEAASCLYADNTRRTMVNVGYFNATQNVAMTVFGVLAGAVMRVHRRYKVCPPSTPHE